MRRNGARKGVSVKPTVLQRGDTIGIVAPAGVVRAERLEVGIRALKDLGFGVILGKHVFDQRGYLAGFDADRASDLMEMFLSPDVRGIIVARGGYGTMRMLDLLDYTAIALHAKPLVGSSDITALHLALDRAEIVSFHGPMVEMDPDKGPPRYNLEGLLRALTSSQPLGILCQPEGRSIRTLVGGVAKGRLVGGNLSLLVATMGTRYEVRTAGRLLMIEEVGEAPYRVDRMLCQLRMAGKLEAACGIVVGDMTRCGSVSQASPDITDVLKDALAGLGKPCVTGMAFGHGLYKATFPLGVEARLDADRGVLEVLEGALEEGCR